MNAETGFFIVALLATFVIVMSELYYVLDNLD